VRIKAAVGDAVNGGFFSRLSCRVIRHKLLLNRPQQGQRLGFGFAPPFPPVRTSLVVYEVGENDVQSRGR
jgi:hypothetical protein